MSARLRTCTLAQLVAELKDRQQASARRVLAEIVRRQSLRGEQRCHRRGAVRFADGNARDEDPAMATLAGKQRRT